MKRLRQIENEGCPKFPKIDNCSFDHPLPVEIWFYIFSFLPMFPLMNVRKICKSFALRKDLFFSLTLRYKTILLFKMADYFMENQKKIGGEEFCDTFTWGNIFDLFGYFQKPAFMEEVLESLKSHKNEQYTGKYINNLFKSYPVMIRIGNALCRPQDIDNYSMHFKTIMITNMINSIFRTQK